LGASLMSTEVPMIAVYLVAVVIGISTFSFHGVYNTLIGEQAKVGQVGVTVGVASTLNNVTQIAMPPLFGYMVDINNSYSLAWRVVAAAAMVCTLVFLTFEREPQRR
ncbi:hypothetical protein ACFLUO_05125, partial [Chloroflexota bacterium]